MIKHIVKFFAWFVASWVSGFYVSVQHEKHSEMPIFSTIFFVISMMMMLRSFILGTQLLGYRPKKLKKQEVAD